MGSRNYWSSWMLCVVIFLVFIVQNIFPGLTDGLALDSRFVSEPWLLITSMFIHGSSLHLLGNLFALGLFGILLEQEIGTRRFLIIYFVAGIIAGLIGSFFYPSLIGASGSIFGAMGTLAVMKPKMTVWTYGVPMPMVVAAAFWLLLDIGGVFYPTNVANIAHIAGLAFGVLVGLLIRKPEPKKPKRTRLLDDGDFNRWEDRWFGI